MNASQDARYGVPFPSQVPNRTEDFRVKLSKMYRIRIYSL